MYLGIEIGGTKLQLGLGEGDGELRGVWRGPVDVQAGADGIRRQILQAVPELLVKGGLDRTRVKGIGIGFGGPVDDATRTVIKSHQIEGWDNFPLADWMADLLGWPAVLGNDADVAGLGEALFGAGKGLSPIFYITIGSGIGGGLIINGEIYRGCGRGAAEIGHLRISTQMGGQVFWPILERISSGWALEEAVRTEASYLSKADPQQVLELAGGNWKDIKAHHLAEAARNEDPFAWDFLRRAWMSLAEGICHIIALLCPRRIIIGGGISLMGDILFEPLRAFVAERVFEPFADCYDIVPAVLGEEVVVHGGCAGEEAAWVVLGVPELNSPGERLDDLALNQVAVLG